VTEQLRNQKVKLRQDTSLNVPLHEVIAEARANGLSVQQLSGYGKVLDARLLAVEGRICQIIRTRQVIDSHYPDAVYAPLYLPQTKVADLLIYVAFPSSGPPRFYVVPRGVMTKNTAWSLESLEQYRNAWNVFKQPLVPSLTERRFTILNWQLQAVIKAAEEAALDVTLIRLKKSRPWPTFIQRQIIVAERNCAVYSCSRLSPDPTAPRHNFIFLRAPSDKRSEFQLCRVKDGPSECAIYVVPCRAIKKKTTISLENPVFQSFKDNWKLLSTPISELATITPIEWRRPKIVRPKEELPDALAKIVWPKKRLPEALVKTILEAQSQGLSVELVTQREAGIYPRNKCLHISQKPCQIVQAMLVTTGRYKGNYVSVDVPATDWAEFVVFIVTPEADGETPTFYVVPCTRFIEDTVVLPSWFRDYKNAWHHLHI
jgi:hypothetical protein